MAQIRTTQNNALETRSKPASFISYGNVNNGFTLVELLVTISIAGIMAALAAPTLNESIQNSRVKELSSELTVALHLVQSEAIKRGIQVSINPLQTSGNEWQMGWDIFVDPNANGMLDTGEEIIQTYQIPQDGLTLNSKDSVFASWLSFLPSGASRGNAGINGGFQICRPDGDITKSRSITIQASGNIIVEVGTLTCP